jgi:recombination protein RecA
MAPAKKTVKKVAKKKVVKTPTKDELAAKKFLDGLRKDGMMGDINKKIDFISSGSWVVNRLIGDGSLSNTPGGIPRGFVTEIYGNEGCGKTTLALHAAKQAQEDGGLVIFADFEFSLRAQKKYIENIGVSLDPDKFIHLEPTNFEDGVKAIGNALITLKPALIIIDSVTAMLPKSTFEAEADEGTQIGKQARLMGTFLNWITTRLGKYNSSLILLNQLRSVIKASKYEAGPNEITSGGRSVRYFTALRIELRATSKKEEVTERSNITGASEKKIVNQEVKAIIRKNKLDVPYKSGPIYITFGEGIDNILSLISLAEGKKVIKKSSGWYQWEDPNGEHNFKVLGKQKVKAYFEENPEALNALKPYLNPTQDTDVIKERLDALKEVEAEKSELSKEDQKELDDLQGLNFGDNSDGANFEEE